ncbi:MAG: hypothetical protein V7K48_01735 [Nostoc sp.]
MNFVLAKQHSQEYDAIAKIAEITPAKKCKNRHNSNLVVCQAKNCQFERK